MAPNFAYCTLITRSSYLAGVLILAYTLKKQGSVYPLIVLYTDTLPASSVRALQLEAPHSNLILHRVDPLLPRANIHVHLIAERFADTWTKLRVFQLHELQPWDTLCYLDADMILLKNMDQVFTHKLPSPSFIAANHACVCNLDADPWAPADWTKQNCAYTPLTHPSALTCPTPVTESSPPTYHLLNSGMFLFAPRAELWSRMLDFFNTTPDLANFKFPDQDFLAAFFHARWQPVGWQFNALKTMRYWHPNIWRDAEVVCLHYIVDKPWAKRNGDDGVAGYLGRDGVTHQWWWNEFGEWEGGWAERGEEGEEMRGIVRKCVARKDGDDGAESEDEGLKAIGSQVQAFAKNEKPSGAQESGSEAAKHASHEQSHGHEGDGDGDGEAGGQHHAMLLANGGKILGERGHGPRLRGGPVKFMKPAPKE